MAIFERGFAKGIEKEPSFYSQLTLEDKKEVFERVYREQKERERENKTKLVDVTVHIADLDKLMSGLEALIRELKS